MLKKVWSFLLSLRLTIALLIILSAVCIIGTVVPQNAAEQEYLRLYSPSTLEILKALGFTDMYHCWWFMATLGLFTLNLAACSINRLPRMRRLLAPMATILTEEQLQSLGNVKKFTIKKNAPSAEALAAAVGRFLCQPSVTRQEGALHIVAEKGRYSRLAFYLTHSGMIIIIAGVLLGTLGFQGYMQLDEGETQSTVMLRKPRAERDLGFALRCDRFEVSYYDKSGMPKDYKSWLTVIEGGREVLQKVIEVNDPLIYKGIFFYQSSYGAAAAAGGEVLVHLQPAGGKKAAPYRVRRGQRFTIEGTEDEAEVTSIVADFGMDNGRVFSRSNEPRNPAAQITIYRAGAPLQTSWAFMKFPDFHQKADQAYTVKLANFYPSYYTGLQVTRDPGVNIVWLGCLLLTGGICMAFFMSHRRVCLLVQEQDGSLRAVLAGSASKNRQAFAAALNVLFEQLKSLEKRS